MALIPGGGGVWKSELLKKTYKEGEYVVRYFLYKNECRNFKTVEITIRRELSRKEKNGGEEPIRIIIHIYMEMS
jgi:hypothetical protein